MRQMPAPSRALDDGQGDAGPARGQGADALVVEVDAVREPHVGPEPAERLEVLDRAAAELLPAELVLVDRLGEVRVQADTSVRASAADCSSRSPVTENGEHGATPTRSIESGEGSWCRSIASVVARGSRRSPPRPGRAGVRRGSRRGPSSRGSAGSAGRPPARPGSPRRAGRRRRRETRSGGPSSWCSRSGRAGRARRSRPPAHRPRRGRPTPGTASSASRTAWSTATPRVSHW